jgi:hypothetical protein
MGFNFPNPIRAAQNFASGAQRAVTNTVQSAQRNIGNTVNQVKSFAGQQVNNVQKQAQNVQKQVGSFANNAQKSLNSAYQSNVAKPLQKAQSQLSSSINNTQKSLSNSFQSNVAKPLQKTQSQLSSSVNNTQKSLSNSFQSNVVKPFQATQNKIEQSFNNTQKQIGQTTQQLQKNFNQSVQSTQKMMGQKADAVQKQLNQGLEGKTGYERFSQRMDNALKVSEKVGDKLAHFNQVGGVPSSSTRNLNVAGEAIKTATDITKGVGSLINGTPKWASSAGDLISGKEPFNMKEAGAAVFRSVSKLGYGIVSGGGDLLAKAVVPGGGRDIYSNASNSLQKSLSDSYERDAKKLGLDPNSKTSKTVEQFTDVAGTVATFLIPGAKGKGGALVKTEQVAAGAERAMGAKPLATAEQRLLAPAAQQKLLPPAGGTLGNMARQRTGNTTQPITNPVLVTPPKANANPVTQKALPSANVPLESPRLDAGGAARAEKSSVQNRPGTNRDYWIKASATETIEKVAGKNPIIEYTRSGKTTYTNPTTKAQVVYDNAGRYFRVFDAKGKPAYADGTSMGQNMPILNPKTGLMKSAGVKKNELQPFTHFADMDPAVRNAGRVLHDGKNTSVHIKDH